jgi:hypothetical protein
MRGQQLIVVTGLAVVAAVLVHAGPLSPPAGSVASTYKTLAEVDPGTPLSSVPAGGGAKHYITQPGRYYLTGNLVGNPGQDGVIVAASDVTIDLRGFSLQGGQNPGSKGIQDAPNASRVVIRNGSIVGWGLNAVFNNSGTDWVCRDLVVATTGNIAIQLNTQAVVEGCNVKGAGYFGVSTLGMSRVMRTTVSDCANAGIAAGSGSRVEACEVTRCTVAGVLGSYGVTVVDSTINETHVGTWGGHGMYLDGNATVERCTLMRNDGDGICSSQGGIVVRGCTANWNKGNGINANSSSLIEENHVHANGTNAGGAASAGILVRGSATRVQGNHLAYNNTAVQLQGSQNLVVRNSFSMNGAHVAGGAGNSVAQIVQAPANGFVSTDPWANFNY